ncbi:MAG: TIR domain-containing protein, partial [Chloroflexi bacterium]|nr:TIR domain-containing protein [Chloroflexota bacterium]
MAAQSISRKTRIFISYSRKNKRFARKLNEALDKSGIEAWVDWEGIPPSAEWMQEVAAAIQASDAFVFIISPDSLKSKVCMEELELGIRYNKKIIPVVYCDAEKKQKIHPTLAALNWVYMRPRKEDFKSAVKLLTESIQTDLGWMHQHTRLLQRASEWEQKGRNPHYLLRGSDLSDSEAWLIESTKNTTRSVLPIQAEYINSSRKETMRRQRRFTIGVGLAMALSLFLGVFSLNQWRKAEENAALAKNNAATAIVSSNIAATQQARAEESELRALTNETIALAQRSAVQAGIYEARPGGLYTSALLALDSWRRFQTHEAEDILRQNLSRMASPVGQLRQEGAITGIGFSPDGERFFTSSDNGSVR